MHSIRRAALRSALSASRALPVKASSAPFASTIAKAATASRLVPIQSVRFYSQEPIEQAEQAEQASAEIQEASQEVSHENEVAKSEERSSSSAPTGTHTLAPPFLDGIFDRSKTDHFLPAHAAFVRNLVFEVTETHLKEAFEKYGTVVDAHVVRDPRGMSKGYVAPSRSPCHAS